MALSSGHLELSARLGSRHRRRRSPLPRRVRRGRWGARQRGARLGRGRAFCGGVEARWQRSTVKASYSRNGRSASWAAHGTYLAREGARREGGKGRGFSAEQEGIDLPATLRSWQRAGDERLWKFIVAPEHAERLDLKAHTRALVSHMERDLGTRLEWVAIDRQPARPSPRPWSGRPRPGPPDPSRLPEPGYPPAKSRPADPSARLSRGTRDGAGAWAVHRAAPLHRRRPGTHPSRGNARSGDDRRATPKVAGSEGVQAAGAETPAGARRPRPRR